MRSLGAALLVLGLVACSSSPPDDSKTDAGPVQTTDAGPIANGPLPAPLLRLDDGHNGEGRSKTFFGVVTGIGAVSTPPTSLDVTPATHLDISSSGGPQPTLYYTLPIPYRILLFKNDQAQLTFKEASGTASTPHSYGVLITGLPPSLPLVMLAEDGASGPAFTKDERLGFDFELDTQVQATKRETVECGEKAHYPANVTQGGRTEHLYPGESAVFSVNGADVKFTLLDMYRLENSTCGAASEYSIAYIAQLNR